jgi:hypothetical protein
MTMNNTQLQLVTYEQAKRLKEAGFDWKQCATTKGPIGQCYTPSGEMLLTTNLLRFSDTPFVSVTDCVSASTVALALKWMRDVKGVACAVNVRNEIRVFSNKSTYAPIFIKHGITTEGKTCDTYESAESELLDELLTLFEKKS